MKRLCKWLYCPKIITVFAPVKCSSTWMCCNCIWFVLWAVLFEIVVLTCHVYSVQNLYLILIIIIHCWLVLIQLRNDSNYYQTSSFHLHPPSKGPQFSIFSTTSGLRWISDFLLSVWLQTILTWNYCLIGIVIVYDFMAWMTFDIITEKMTNTISRSRGWDGDFYNNTWRIIH